MQRAAMLLLAVTLCTSCTGCLALYSKRNVDIYVTRTDTGEPAVGVPVDVQYLFMFILNPPNRAEATTDSAGKVKLSLADFGDGGILKAGTTEYHAPVNTIRFGGKLEYKASANPDEPVPTYAVRLVPRWRSNLESLVGMTESATSIESAPVGTTPPD
jgi:hypothetical protein